MTSWRYWASAAPRAHPEPNTEAESAVSIYGLTDAAELTLLSVVDAEVATLCC